MSQVQFTNILYIYIIFCINLDHIEALIASRADVTFSTSTIPDGEAPIGTGHSQPHALNNNSVGKVLNKII
jgi:hypothetical protein